jgi:hypothetical protein
MSEITELAAGTVTASDEITVQLVDNIEVSKRDGPETALYELVRISLSVFDNFSLEARAAVVRECAETERSAIADYPALERVDFDVTLQQIRAVRSIPRCRSLC